MTLNPSPQLIQNPNPVADHKSKIIDNLIAASEELLQSILDPTDDFFKIIDKMRRALAEAKTQ